MSVATLIEIVSGENVEGARSVSLQTVAARNVPGKRMQPVKTCASLNGPAVASGGRASPSDAAVLPPGCSSPVSPPP